MDVAEWLRHFVSVQPAGRKRFRASATSEHRGYSSTRHRPTANSEESNTAFLRPQSSFFLSHDVMQSHMRPPVDLRISEDRAVPSARPGARPRDQALAPRGAFVRWLVFLLLGLALAHPIALRADTFGNFTYSVADGAVTITRYTGSDTSLVIPDQIANLPVTSIEGFAFSANSSLIFITLPSSVSMVGERAFASCPALTSISVDPANPHFASADGVLFDKTFQTLIQAPGGLVGAYSPPAELTTIGNSAFRDCKKLTDLTLPDGLASIGNEAFYGCSGLTDTTLPESLGSMGKFAFYGCIKLSSIALPAAISVIGEGPFASCSALTSISVDPTNPHFASADGVLFDKTFQTLIQAPGGLAGAYSLPADVTTIGNSAFRRCNKLTGITLPEGLASIGDYAFWFCASLTSINIPGGVGSIREGTFSNCPLLKSVTLQPGIVSIEEHAFSSCPNLGSVTLPEGLRSIGTAAFYADTELTSINLPASLTSIGDHAFDSCFRLKNVSPPPSLTYIGDSAFFACPGLAHLTTLDLPAITHIGSRAFDGCSKLTAVTLSDNLVFIGSWAFLSCSSLTNITLPASLSSIRDYAFSDCAKLREVRFLGDAPSMGNGLV